MNLLNCKSVWEFRASGLDAAISCATHAESTRVELDSIWLAEIFSCWAGVQRLFKFIAKQAAPQKRSPNRPAFLKMNSLQTKCTVFCFNLKMVAIITTTSYTGQYRAHLLDSRLKGTTRLLGLAKESLATGKHVQGMPGHRNFVQKVCHCKRYRFYIFKRDCDAFWIAALQRP